MNARKVLVVGGGSAGWMTATYLNATLNRAGLRRAEITLVESPIEPVGTTAGAEATLPDTNRFLSILGLDQVRFMQQVGGTLSHGTRFVSWLDGAGEHYYHPFGMERRGSIDRAGDRWFRSNRCIPFADTISVQPALCDQNLAPLMLGRWDFGERLPYGFHVDERRFADCLKALGLSVGVTHVADPAIDAELSGDDGIAAILTEGGRRIEADLFIDCSGPAALLFEKMGVDWVDRSESLPCNRRIAVDVSCEQHFTGQVRPYRTATALSSGWLQDIPLQDRRSLVYFFSAAHLGDEEARQELAAVEGSHADSLPFDVSGLRTGHRQKAWVGNCIAIGSACNAIEPLEPGNLYLVDHAASMLAEHFPLGEELAPLAFRYNRIMANRFYEFLDFVNLHYCLTRRTDTDFWRLAREPERVTDRLRAKLDFWRSKRPTPADFEDQNFPDLVPSPLPAGHGPGDFRSPVDTAALWNHENYEAILYGMDFLGRECGDRFGEHRSIPEVPPQIATRIAEAAKKLPPHVVWLQRMAGMPAYPIR